MNWFKDFMWGTFNYRNKGIRWYRWPLVGFGFANLRRFDRLINLLNESKSYQ